MSNLIHQPMDKLFKQSMAEIIVARKFFETHLPTELLKKIDLSTLRQEKNSFIDEVFKATEADILYSVSKGKRIAYLYLLCEQQSEVDKEIAFRLLVSTVRIMQMHQKQFPKRPLPVVYPLVLYSGKKPWNAPRDIFPLFGNEEALAREYLFKPYQLLDIYRTPDEELRKHDWCGLVEFALKYRKAQDFARILDTIFPWLKEITLQDSRSEVLRKMVLHYVLDSMDGANADLDIFVQKTNEYLSADLRGEAMTIAQQLEQRGFAKGIQQGIQQGMQQGEKNLLLRQIQRKFGEIPARYRKLIENADANTLLELAEALIEAKSPEEMFE